MSNTTFTGRKNTGQPLSILLLGALLLLAFYFIITEALPYSRFNIDAYGDSYWSVKWWLAGHLAGGVLALVIGPFQFWSRFRNRYMKLHRNLGKIYIIAILISAICALYMAFTISLNVNFSWSLGLAFLAIPWIVCALMAYRMIRLRRISQHREWMIRSYVVTFGFVIFRIVENAAITESLMETFAERGPAVIWMCWAVPLFFTEVALQWNKKD